MNARHRGTSTVASMLITGIAALPTTTARIAKQESFTVRKICEPVGMAERSDPFTCSTRIVSKSLL